MTKVFARTKGLIDVPNHYCPGCGHGIVHRLVAEVLEEMDLLDHTVGVAPVGCAVFAYNYFNCDMYEAAHGRAPAVATGAKRVFPNNCVFTYQGDGDLASIGTAEIVHAAHRGEKSTTTSPKGRDKDLCGEPIRMAELLATIEVSAYIERTAVNNNANIIKTKKAIRKAFETQMERKGFSMVEVLSTCPTNWGKSPIEAMQWLEDEMIPYYPLGVFKEV